MLAETGLAGVHEAEQYKWTPWMSYFFSFPVVVANESSRFNSKEGVGARECTDTGKVAEDLGSVELARV